MGILAAPSDLRPFWDLTPTALVVKVRRPPSRTVLKPTSNSFARANRSPWISPDNLRDHSESATSLLLDWVQCWQLGQSHSPSHAHSLRTASQ